MGYIDGSKCSKCGKTLFVAEPGKLATGNMQGFLHAQMDTAYQCVDCEAIVCAECVQNPSSAACKCGVGAEFHRVKDPNELSEIGRQRSWWKFWK